MNCHGVLRCCHQFVKCKKVMSQHVASASFHETWRELPLADGDKLPWKVVLSNYKVDRNWEKMCQMRNTWNKGSSRTNFNKFPGTLHSISWSYITFMAMSKSSRSWIAAESDDSGPMHGEMAEPAHLGICVQLATSLSDLLKTWRNKHACLYSTDWNISPKLLLGPFPLDHSVMSVVHLSRYHCIKVVTLLDQCICKWKQSLPSLVLCARPVFGRGAFHPHGGQ